MQQTKFKQTEIGEIPEDWQVVKLGDQRISTIKYGRAKPKEEGHIPVVGSSGAYDYANKALVDPPVIVVGRKGTAGEIFLFKKPCWPSDTTFYVKLVSDMINVDYLFFFLKSRKISGEEAKTTLPSLRYQELYDQLIPLPPLPEQQKIASILSTIDDAIQKTDEIIQKTHELKRGLMQQLLTRGIGHEKFKQTEIGEIPEEWEVVKLGEVAEDVKVGFASGKRDEKGIVQIRMNNLTTDGRIVLDSYLKVPVPPDISDYSLTPGDLLFNNTNSIDLVGKSAIFNGAPFPCAFSNHFTRIKFKKNFVIPEWVLNHFVAFWRNGFFQRIAIRHVGQSAVRTEDLVKVKLPLPSLSEQRKITSILSSVEEKIEKERQRKEYLQRLKKGMMQDLLTGRVRVKVD